MTKTEIAGLDAAFATFSDRLRKRWDAGAKRYGDQSFAAPMTETCRQIMEELEDVPGWAFVLWIQARIACGEAIDLTRRQDYEAEFLRAMQSNKEPRNVVERIAQMAGDDFYRWHNRRMALAGVVHELAQQRTGDR